MFSNIGMSEWAVIILVILFLFGGKKLPEFMKGIGRGIREFRDSMENIKKEVGLNIEEASKHISDITKETEPASPEPGAKPTTGPGLSSEPTMGINVDPEVAEHEQKSESGQNP